MTPEDIEIIINECKEMASEPVFNLEEGHTRAVNQERYIELLEGLVRSVLRRNIKIIGK